MHRRAILLGSGAVFGGAMSGATAITTAAQDDTDDQQSEPEPLEFDGEGVGVTDEFEIQGGPTVIESAHDGESTFFVQAVPREDGQEQSLVEQTGEFEGTTGTFVEEGTYVIYVDADGSWELIVRQPRVSEDEADDPPVSFDGSGPDWIGPILFDGTTQVGGIFDSEGSFRVEVVPQDEASSDFVWGGGELVFTAIGSFRGITTAETDGIGYLSIEAGADDEWILEVE